MPLIPQTLGRRSALAAGAALLIVGSGAGAIATGVLRPAATMAPATPVPIGSLAGRSDETIVTLRGRVAETYGNAFVMQDASGRMLVDTGREGARSGMVKAGQPITVQGRWDDGQVHAAFLVGADGSVKAVGPFGPPPHGPRGPGGPEGGPDRGPDARRGPAGAGPDLPPPLAPAAIMAQGASPAASRTKTSR